MKVVGGSASVLLARGIAHELSVGFVDVAFEKHPGGFPDGERYVRLLGPVSGEHVVLVQTTHPDPMIVELFLLADAIRDAGARRITAVVPYFGYGRQDKRFLDGEAVSAKTIAKHIAVDCNELLTMAIPANPEVLKTFPLPTREVSGMPAIGRYLKSAKVDVLLAPDEGALRLAKEASAIAGVPFDFLVKERIDSYTVTIEPKALAVKGKSVGMPTVAVRISPPHPSKPMFCMSVVRFDPGAPPTLKNAAMAPPLTTRKRARFRTFASRLNAARTPPSHQPNTPTAFSANTIRLDRYDSTGLAGPYAPGYGCGGCILSTSPRDGFRLIKL